MFDNDLDPRDFESRESADKKVFVKFYTKPVQNEAKSAAEGRPIFDEREYIEIRTPGQQNNVIQRPVCDMDRQRFRESYRQFKAGIEDQVVGTPLEEVPFLTRSQVEELRYLRIRSLEHLSELNDQVCGQHAGLYALKQKAQKFLQAANGAAPITDLQRQIDEMKALVESQNQTIADQSKIIQNLKSSK